MLVVSIPCFSLLHPVPRTYPSLKRRLKRCGAYAGSIVHKLLPFIRPKQPALVQLGSDMRYSDIIKEANRDAATVSALLLAAFMVGCLKVAKVV